MATKPTKTNTIRNKFDNLSYSNIEALTKGQEKMIEYFLAGYNIAAVGSAGTGKTYVAAYLALRKLFNREVDRIVILRSAVNIRNQGYLKGTLEEKEIIYTMPFVNIFNQICQNGTAWDILTKKGMVEFLTTTYVRGITLDNCVVIVDEIQNMDASECESVLTRLGENCQVILCGDTRQNDLSRKREQSCYDWLMTLLDNLPEYFRCIKFTKEDIVRSELCKAIITAIEEL